METLYTTFKNIANILSFETGENTLKQSLDSIDTNWDTIVKIGSRHLVLPAIYCRLKQKHALHLLPYDLNSYLEELTEINRNRNTTLLNEAKEIHILFTEHNINHVYIKGVALIAGNFFVDRGERMIGDIDILVHENHLDFAYELLLQNNYIPVKQTISSKYFKNKHLPRLVNSKKMGAIELHKNIFNQKINNLLNVNSILNQKRCIDGLNIPSSEHLLSHNVLNYQINDHGFYFNSLSLRPAYDSIVILNHDPHLQISFESKYYSQYFHNLSVFFSEIKTPQKSNLEGFLLNFFKLKHESKAFGKIWYFILNKYRTLSIFMHRSFVFIKNKNYRNDILKDSKRVRKVFFKRIK